MSAAVKARSARGTGAMLDVLRDDPDDYGWNRLVLGRHGAFLANPLDRYLGQAMVVYGEYSEAEVDLFRLILDEGDRVVEAGANAGYLTVPLARIVGPKGRVIAFEPQRIVFQTLCGNLALNGLANVEALQIALGVTRGISLVPQIDPTKPGNYGGVEIEGDISDPGAVTEAVERFALDDYPLEGVRLLKVDVEGMELQVLAGARHTIARSRPILYVEADRAEKAPGIIREIQAANYSTWWHFPPLFNPANFYGIGTNYYPTTVSINVLAVPRERVADLFGGPNGAALEGMFEKAMVAHPEEMWQDAFRRVAEVRQV